MVRIVMTLADLPSGQSGRVGDIQSDSPLGQRLLDLGFVPGTRVTSLRLAPLGDPMAVSIRGSVIGLRKSEARLVLLEPI